MNYVLKKKLEIISFVSGAVLMTVELVGSRLISPYLGVSTFIWTSIIGIILGFLSLGYWYGGRLSLRNPNVGTLSKILFGSFLSLASILFLQPLVSSFSLISIDLRILAVFASILLFGPMSFFLGMVTPYIARLKIESTVESGSIVGTLYAVSTFGSILGTFLGGFFLISFMGISSIIFWASFTLFLTFIFSSLNESFSKEMFVSGLVILISIFFIPKFVLGSVIDIDTLYNRWVIYDLKDHAGQDIRLLRNSIVGAQSGIYKNDPIRLFSSYLQTFDMAPDLYKNPIETLLLGAGAYTYPMHFIAKYPDSKMDVVEIDGQLENIAQNFFGFRKSKNLFVYNMDARMFLKNNTKKYDVIFMDAFSSELSIPYHLTTLETVRDLKKSLKDDGIIIINLISAIKGPNSRFISAIWNTYSQVFPNNYALNMSMKSSSKVQNIVLVVSNKDIAFAITPGWEIINPVNFDKNIPVLTDEFAPVESYISGFLQDLI